MISVRITNPNRYQVTRIGAMICFALLNSMHMGSAIDLYQMYVHIIIKLV